ARVRLSGEFPGFLPDSPNGSAEQECFARVSHPRLDAVQRPAIAVAQQQREPDVGDRGELICGRKWHAVGMGRAGSADIVGREDQLARLEAAASQARDGRGSCLLITGEPGAGKTHLVATAATRW